MKASLKNNINLIENLELVKPEVTFADIAIIFDILEVSYENAVEAFETHFNQALETKVEEMRAKL